MNKLLEKLTQLFKSKSKVEVKSIIHNQYDWKSIEYDDVGLPIKNELYQQFIDWLPNKTNRNPSILFFDNDKSRGYALRGEVLLGLNRSVFMLIKNHIEMLVVEGYKVKISEVSSHQTPNGMVTKYHIYLKPSLKFRSFPKSQQIFGNISMEYLIEDDIPNHFRLLSHTYNDQNFEPALPMEDLMQILALS